MVNFEENFWGEKYNGFEVLQQNFKLGLNTGKEFAEFLKERSSIEETYSKSLLKLANKCASANQHVGTFEPCWKYLQSSTEKLANVHNQIIQHLNDVSKSVRDYGELQKERQKQMKDDFVSTTEAVLNLQSLSAALIKARELYQQRSQEVEKCRKDLTNLKDIKTAEQKYKKSTEDYKQLVDRRETARKDYCIKISEISQKLQTVEEEHLTSMLEILTKYGDSLKTERFLLDQIIDEFGRNMLALTVENLLQQFVHQKMTGKGCPLPLDFEDAQIQSKPVDLDAIAIQLKEEKKRRKAEKRDRKAERKKKKEKSSPANGTVDGSAEEPATDQNELQIDEEGYVIRPSDTDSLNSGKLSKESFSSDSDSEDSDAERQKIKVRIKPVEESKGSNTNLSQEELKQLSATLTLMSPSTVHQRKSHLEDRRFAYGWGSDNTLNKKAFKSKSNIDLLNLDQNSDTASIHSLPVNSSFPALHAAEEICIVRGKLPFDESSTSSPIPSPPNEVDFLDGSGNLSRSVSFDRTAKSLENIEKSVMDEINDFDVPPPLPLKIKATSSGASSCNSTSEIDIKEQYSAEMNQTEENETDLKDIVPCNAEFKDTSFVKKMLSTSNAVNSDILSCSPDQDASPSDYSEKLLSMSTYEGITPSTTANMKTLTNISFTTLEALKPPPSEKRQIHYTTTDLTRTISNTAVPRPKPGQLMAVNSRPNETSLSSSSASILQSNLSSQSSLSDLLEINFSTTNKDSTLITQHVTLETSTISTSAVSFSTSCVVSQSAVASLSVLATAEKEDEHHDSLLSEAIDTISESVSNKEDLSFDKDVNLHFVPNRIMISPTVGNVNADRAVPIAVAFIETVNGVFRGPDEKSCVVKVTGDMTISFPANMISVLSNNPQTPPLSFLVSGTSSLEQIFPNKQLVERAGQLPGGEGMLYKFDMASLAMYLKKQAEQSSKASYYNIDILKYQVRCCGITSAPLQLSSYWRCDPDQTDLKIDYSYNSTCMSSQVPLHNISIVVPVDGGVEIMQSKPTATWSSEHQRCMWKLASISTTENTPVTNVLRARFDVTSGPTTPVPIAVQFTGEGSTISSLNFDIKSPGYKLSLVKKRFTTGKYMVEAS